MLRAVVVLVYDTNEGILSKIFFLQRQKRESMKEEEFGVPLQDPSDVSMLPKQCFPNVDEFRENSTRIMKLDWIHLSQ